MNKQFYFKQFSIIHLFKFQTILFVLQIEPYQMLTLQARVDLGAMTMKGYRIPHNSKTGASPSDCLMLYSRHLSYSSAETQSVNYTGQPD